MSVFSTLEVSLYKTTRDNREKIMFQKFIKLTTDFALSTGVAVPAYAELSGTLRITSDMSNQRRVR